jgi:uncharacterized protein YqgC (DUF456 family)
MIGLVTVLVALTMAVGIVGTIIPVLPGLGLVLTAGIVYGFVVGWSVVGLVAITVMLVLLALGTAAKMILADRKRGRGGAPRRSLLIGAAAAVVGFFVIPVIGLAVGGVAGLMIAEHERTGAWDSAWRSTRTTLVGVGTGVLLEVAAGVGMAMVWLIWALVR